MTLPLRISGEAEANRLRFAGGSVPLGLNTAGVTEVMFRPEDVQLVSQAAANFSGKIVSSFFLGDHTRLVVDVGDGQWVTVRAQQRARFAAGDSVHCAIEPGSVLAVKSLQ